VCEVIDLVALLFPKERATISETWLISDVSISKNCAFIREWPIRRWSTYSTGGSMLECRDKRFTRFGATSCRDSCRACYWPSTSTTISLPTRKIRERVSVNRTLMQREIRPPFGFGLVFVVGYYLGNPASGDLSFVPRRRYE